MSASSRHPKQPAVAVAADNNPLRLERYTSGRDDTTDGPHMKMRVCSRPGCPVLVPGGGLCPTDRAAADRERGTPTERGYGADHRALRRAWAKKVMAGGVCCARCGKPIAGTDLWHLDHTDDRTGYLGPSCAPCNTAAANRNR